MLPASERPLIDATTALVEDQLDPAELTAVREQGPALPLAEVVEAVLSEP